ncbi:hypothetical protein AB0I28_19820 [Phytomonospora sp. NPDC050363]|uniref:hypothetical protein n=1 Tax=Phytomonospora sp. NPDC050363 TaxID=3155642 RepID=UPI0033F0E013
MSISPSTTVLKSAGDSSMRLDGTDLLLTQVDFEHRIPLKAIAEVHAEGRSLAVTLKARWEDEPTVFRIGDVNEDAAAAFAGDLTAALPEPGNDQQVNGAWIVATSTISPEPQEGSNGFLVGAVVTLLAIIGLAVYAGIMGGFWSAVGVAIVGGITAFVFAGAIVHFEPAMLAWSLPRRALKATATFSHVGTYRRIHLYVDKDGNTRAFSGLYSSSGAWAPKEIEVQYDPADPGTKLRADEGRWGKAIGLTFLAALASLGMAGTVLVAFGYI